MTREPLVGADLDLRVSKRRALLETLGEPLDGAAERRRGRTSPSTTTITESTVPTPNSCSRARKPSFEGTPSGKELRPGPESRRSSAGAAAARSKGDRGDEADHRPPHHGASDPRPEAALATGRLDGPPEERDAKRVDPDRRGGPSSAGTSVSAASTETNADRDAR